MPRIWLDYCQFLVEQGRITRTRRTFDRALRALPITQHHRIWPLYLQFVRRYPLPETAVRVYRRFLKVPPRRRRPPSGWWDAPWGHLGAVEHPTVSAQGSGTPHGVTSGSWNAPRCHPRVVECPMVLPQGRGTPSGGTR